MPEQKLVPADAAQDRPSDAASRLLSGPLRVVNVGLDGFADDLERQGVAVTRVDWSPPAGGDPALAALLAKLGT
jgi:FdrA protein